MSTKILCGFGDDLGLYLLSFSTAFTFNLVRISYEPEIRCDSLLDCFLFKIADMFVGKFDTITGFDQCLVSFSFSGLGIRDTLTRSYDTLIIVEKMLVAASAKDSAPKGTVA
jgi:hypothetical protein